MKDELKRARAELKRAIKDYVKVWEEKREFLLTTEMLTTETLERWKTLDAREKKAYERKTEAERRFTELLRQSSE